MSKAAEQSKASSSKPLSGVFRPAVIKDAWSIQKLLKIYADQGQMLQRSINELYETIRQYIIYEEDGGIAGVCGLHVTWEDLAEVRALAVEPSRTGRGIGERLLSLALEEARRLGIPNVFTLTYTPEFFEKAGFKVVDKSEFPQKIWGECVRCHKFPDCDETGMIIHIGGY